MLGNIQGERVLDLGCGNGWFSVILAKRGALVDGIEISPVAVDISKKRADVNNVGPVTNFQCMSFYELDFPSEYFDKIIGLSVLHHAEHKELLMESLYRVLKPGGRIVFNEPFGNSEWLEKLRLFVPVEIDEEDNTHWNDQIKYKDLDVFKPKFTVRWKEFQFISRLDRVVKSEKMIQYMGLLDRMLLRSIPALRPYARDIVIILGKPKP